MLRLICIILCISSCHMPVSKAQNIDMADYSGMWGGDIHPRALSHDITLVDLGNDQWQLAMSNDETFLNDKYNSKVSNGIEIQLDDQVSLRGEKLNNGNLSAFINSPNYEYHILLTKGSDGKYTGRWNTFYVDQLLPSKLYLAIEEGNGNDYYAYPLIADNRFRGTYVGDFSKKGNSIAFSDQRTGYSFEGILEKENIILDLFLFDRKVTSINLKRESDEVAFRTTAKSKLPTPPNRPQNLGDGLSTSALSAVAVNATSLENMADSINAGALTEVHSVLIAKDGKLVYENYFNGFHANLPHDQRSAAKSIGSAIVGMALEEQIFDNVDQSIYDYIPASYQYTKDDQRLL